MPMNYAGNTYQFRQDSTFLYYFGLMKPNLAAVIDIDNEKEIIFGDERALDDIVWMGFDESIEGRAKKVGVEKLNHFLNLKNILIKK